MTVLEHRQPAVSRRFWAPGRVNLIGEHTDYSDGLVFPAAINLGVTISGQRAEEIVLHSEFAPDVVRLKANGSSPVPLAGWARYVSAVARELDILGRPAVGFSGLVSSTVPSGAGLSSSAALEVAIATALCSVAEWDELDALSLAAACQRAEQRAVGVPCGIMDQAASVLGAAGCAIYLDCGTLEYEPIPLPQGLAIVVVDSGVRHVHEYSSYAQRRTELEEALVVLEGRKPADVALAEAEALAGAGGLDDLHWRRLRHVVTENERVRCVAAILAGRKPVDMQLVGRLFLEGHVSLRDDYETSTPELDALVELAYEHGAVAARMTGGGFGGSIVAFVEDDAAPAFGTAIAAAYHLRHAHVPEVRICTAADGCGELA